MSGLKALCSAVFKDLQKRLPNQRATQRRKLSELVGAVLMCQSPNLMEISNVLDRPIQSPEARYNYVERFLKNTLVKHDTVMEAYGKDLLTRLAENQSVLVLMIDQSKVNNDLELLMVSVRVEQRALPLFWCCKKTSGGIGFNEQKRILEEVKNWIPKGAKVLLAGDRFYGSANLINWCQKERWQYRLRMKGNLLVYQNTGPEKSLNTLYAEGERSIKKARMHIGVITHIGILYEKGHKEPWYIAMDSEPSEYMTRDYGMRWGIENMFSDFKSRGFSLMETQIRISERLERLILVLSIAFHWAVSVGLFLKKKANVREKKIGTHIGKKSRKKQEDLVSHFLRAAYVNSNRVLPWLNGHLLYGNI